MEQASNNSLTTNPGIFTGLRTSDGKRREIAWQDFHDRYAPVIGGFARNYGASPQDIPDLVQDVLMGFFQKSPTFEYDPGKGRFRGYLKACTVHALQKRWAKKPPAEAELASTIAAPASEDTWNDIWEREMLKRALDEVRAHYERAGRHTFKAFQQYVLLGQPPEQVGQSLGVSVDVVYKAKERITQALREKMAEISEQEA